EHASVTSDDSDTQPRRRSLDGWVECACGSRHWGLGGAAGLLLWRGSGTAIEVLLQLRAEWSHFGGTWGITSGASAEGEDACTGADRGAPQEAGISLDEVTVRATHSYERPDWSYATVLARAGAHLHADATDAEADKIAWAALDLVGQEPDSPLLP